MGSKMAEFKEIDIKSISRELDCLIESGDEDNVSYSSSSSRNVFIVTSEDEFPEETTELLGVLTENLPGRYFLLNETDQSGLKCSIAAQCIKLSETEHLCSELLKFSFSPAELPALQSIIRAQKIAGVNTDIIVFSKQLSSSSFRTLREGASEVIFDSRLLTNDDKLLSEVFESKARLVDIGWVRLGPWRRIVAQLFDTEECRNILHEISQIEVSYQNMEGNRDASDPFLIAGWFLAALDLSVSSISAFGYDCERGDGSGVKLSVAGDEFNRAPGEIEQIRIVCSAAEGGQEQVVLFQNSADGLVGSLDSAQGLSFSTPYREMDFVMGVEEHYLVGETFERYPRALKRLLELQALKSGFVGGVETDDATKWWPGGA